MSTFTYPKPGLSNTNSYLTSGIPFVTSSVTAPSSAGGETVVIEFPQVTKFVTIKNTSGDSHSIRVGFSENGVVNENNYFLLAKDESFSAELRVVDLHVMAHTDHSPTFTVIAGLTTIGRSELQTNWSGSAGVG